MQDKTPATECPETRAAMRDYLRNRMLPGRRRRMEDHLVGCAGCIREYVDLRQSRWTAAPVTTRRARPAVDLSVLPRAVLVAVA
ncbi:zf-HC2 domain-containing protein [Myceligenerans crystallogenes]|uniref:Putative zinc-finger domain-containing protein n=1 Tax=Myceligenerans crystallogenes TaxID=316335 RepID=A0ABN2N5T8_9MICO